MTAEIDVVARGVVDANRYMTLGTADASGRPWVSPVWYAADGAGAWSAADVTGPADRRLYRATVSECFLGQADQRTSVSDSYQTSRR